MIELTRLGTMNLIIADGLIGSFKTTTDVDIGRAKAMFLLDGRQLQLDTPFEHDGTSFPANWLRLASPSEREAIGIVELPDYPRPDDRFFFVSQNPDGSWASIPKDLAGLKTTWAAQIRQTAWTLLMPSDWMVVRKQEDGTAIPQEWTDYRAAVRTAAQTAVSNLEAASDIDAFISSVTSVQWPVSPGQQPGV